MNQISWLLLGLPLDRGVFIHKQSSKFPCVFSVFAGVPGLPHSLSSIHFTLHPGFSFKIDLRYVIPVHQTALRTLGNSSLIRRGKTSKDRASECFN